jgi:hypothetical protein
MSSSYDELPLLVLLFLPLPLPLHLMWAIGSQRKTEPTTEMDRRSKTPRQQDAARD